jgi:hypothetical protein
MDHSILNSTAELFRPWKREDDMMTYLRVDEDTGAMFAGSEIPDGQAVLSLFQTPRGEDDLRGNGSAAMLREWIGSLPGRVSRVIAWASNDRDTAFLAGLGFDAETGHVTPEGGRGMVMLRAV